ncbi:copper sensitivity protein ScsC [Vibrio inusitatus NBRC 102082]|uniref:Copper sensitivity protein ScsC n=1 Tax=Vibrio inusitatus NBRC 102082 TaxID=1219070 RepID=A0A4Y3HS88_9VIBR|nr:DsbA family protein [Vibrio inusitatus]GEA50013.1 copper sensitivity protein ScsC [Vibrio inusitatus NBRC 102082]
MNIKTLFISLVASLLVFIAPVNANQNTTTQKIQEIADMLQMHPELVDSLHGNLQTYIEQQDQLKSVLSQSHDYLYNNDLQPSIGNKEAPLTLIVFTDYSCPWCKKFDPELYKLVENNPDTVRVVNLYVPLKEQSSVNSASFGLNVWREKRSSYEDVHQLMVGKPGAHNLNSISKVAKNTDTTAFVNPSMKSDELINKNLALFSDLGLRGTPAMLVDGEIISGYLTYEKLQALVDDKLSNLN